MLGLKHQTLSFHHGAGPPKSINSTARGDDEAFSTSWLRSPWWGRWGPLVRCGGETIGNHRENGDFTNKIMEILWKL